MSELIRKISEITRLIETSYPELYQYLDENPITLPRHKRPKVDEEVLIEYLNSLELLLEKYQRSHERKV